MTKILRSYGGYFVFTLFAIAFAIRSWSLILALVFSLVLFWRFSFRKKATKKLMSNEEEDSIIDAWMPGPLVPELSPEEFMPKPRTIKGKMLKHIDVDGNTLLNLASNDFLAFIGNKRIEQVAQKTITKYGVGACGPRNFYGTVDVHLNLERQLAEFMGCEEAILYSQGFATISSAIAAYSKRGDIIYADKGVNFAIQTGLLASKSTILWFEHNDMNHLEELMKQQAIADKQNPNKAKNIRRFVVVEGIYAKTATICPLPKLIELKWKYKTRIFIDESFSFGVLGHNGKGVTEHFGVDVIDVDLIFASLENALATTGGFCAGRSYVIGHQRLSGLGYCFSASLPPLLTTAASEALQIIQEQPQIVEQLRTNAASLHHLIQTAIRGTRFTLIGADIAPLKHVGYEHGDNEVIEHKLDSLVNEMLENGIFVTKARYLGKEQFQSNPTVKITCRVDLTRDEIEEIVMKFQTAIRKLENFE